MMSMVAMEELEVIDRTLMITDGPKRKHVASAILVNLAYQEEGRDEIR